MQVKRGVSFFEEAEIKKAAKAEAKELSSLPDKYISVTVSQKEIERITKIVHNLSITGSSVVYNGKVVGVRNQKGFEITDKNFITSYVKKILYAL